MTRYRFSALFFAGCAGGCRPDYLLGEVMLPAGLCIQQGIHQAFSSRLRWLILSKREQNGPVFWRSPRLGHEFGKPSLKTADIVCVQMRWALIEHNGRDGDCATGERFNMRKQRAQGAESVRGNQNDGQSRECCQITVECIFRQWR